MTDLKNSLQAYFGNISAEDLQTISSFFRPEQIAKGEFFLKTGKYCDRMSFIRSGFLRIYVQTDKKEVTQWISTQGYFVTDLTSFVFGEPARWTIQALSDTEILTIYKSDYQRLEQLVPKWSMMEKVFIAKCFTMMEDRIFGFLSMSSEERYLTFFEHHQELFNQVPLQYIASMLGMTPETFSRIRNKMSSPNS